MAPVDLVEVVEVEVVWAAAFSAVVSVGGVMSGVLLGTTSEVLLPPPHAAKGHAAEQRQRGERARSSKRREAAAAARSRASGRGVSFTRSVPPHRRALSRLSPPR